MKDCIQFLIAPMIKNDNKVVVKISAYIYNTDNNIEKEKYIGNLIINENSIITVDKFYKAFGTEHTLYYNIKSVLKYYINNCYLLNSKFDNKYILCSLSNPIQISDDPFILE